MSYSIYVNQSSFPKEYKDAMNEYLKRLSAYCKVKIINTDKASIENSFNKAHYSINVTLTGKMYSSEELALKIKNYSIYGISNLDFFVGLNISFADEEISISTLDLDLPLLTTVLLEQIYRSYRIINNQPYHK